MALFGKGKKKDDLVELVNEKYHQRDAKSVLELQWDLNSRFYRGFQNYTLDRDIENNTVRLKDTDERSYETGVVVNVLFSTINNVVAQKLKNKPIIVAVPGTTDRSDITKAKFTNNLIEFWWQMDRVNKRLQAICLDIELFGCSFGKVIWDDNLGDKVERIEKINIKEMEDGSVVEEPKYVTERLGDVTMLHVPPDEILVNPQAKELGDCQWLLHFYTKNADQLKFQYPKFEKDIDSASSSFSREANRIDRPLSDMNMAEQFPKEKSVLVKELYMKPCLDYPNGMYCKVCGDAVLEHAEMEYEDWPWVMFEGSTNPDGFWPEALATQLHPVQEQINMNLDQILSYAHSVINAKTIIYPQGGILADQIVNAQDSILQCSDPAFKPDIIPPPPMPGEMFGIYEVLKECLEEVSHVSKPDKGQNVPGGRSYAVVASLQEATSQYYIPSAIKFEESLLDIIRKVLRIMREKYEDGRMIAVVGKNRSTWVKPFKKDLVIDKDLKIQMGSSLPQSKTATQQLVMEMIQAGLLPVQDPRYRQLALETLDLGSLNVFYSDVLQDEDEADWENDQMAEGVFPPVKHWQNHTKHIEGHVAWGKSVEFKEIENNPAQQRGPNGEQLTIGDIFNQQIKDHQDAIMHQQMQQMQMMMQAQAMAGGQGGMNAAGQQQSVQRGQ